MKKLIAAAASAGLISLSAVSPALATINITVSGNGAGSANTATINNTQTSTVTQYNDADVTNTVDVSANTGDNEANYNTGGTVDVDTGNVTAKSDVTDTVGVNQASVGCNCLDDVIVKIEGNGVDGGNPGSTSSFTLNNTNTNTLTQSNYSTVTNDITVDGNSGRNDANYNTGTGSMVGITTGTVSATSDVDNLINENLASLGVGGDPATILVDIMDNGAGSNNSANLNLTNSATVTQYNDADVLNDITVTGNSGDNEAQYNTGGDVDIDTGTVSAGSTVDNSINFNQADVDCCAFDLTGSISDNGATSTNGINYTDNNTVRPTQTNYCGTGSLEGECDTTVTMDGVSGDNDENYNTNGDVETTTGNATSSSAIVNEINENFLNPTP